METCIAQAPDQIGEAVDIVPALGGSMPVLHNTFPDVQPTGNVGPDQLVPPASPPLVVGKLHIHRVPMLYAVVTTWSQDARNFSVQTPDIRNIASRDRLVDEVEVATVQG